jgi:hypothetical protein
VGALFYKKCTPLRGSYKNTSGFLFENYPDQPCFYPEEPRGTRRLPSSTMNCPGLVDTGPIGLCIMSTSIRGPSQAHGQD